MTGRIQTGQIGGQGRWTGQIAGQGRQMDRTDSWTDRQDRWTGQAEGQDIQMDRTDRQTGQERLKDRTEQTVLT